MTDLTNIKLDLTDNDKEFINVYRMNEAPERFTSVRQLKKRYSDLHYREDTSHLKPVLQDLPTIGGLVGPIYDGKDKYGNECVRYEDYEVYKMLST